MLDAAARVADYIQKAPVLIAMNCWLTASKTPYKHDGTHEEPTGRKS